MGQFVFVSAARTFRSFCTTSSSFFGLLSTLTHSFRSICTDRASWRCTHHDSLPFVLEAEAGSSHFLSCAQRHEFHEVAFFAHPFRFLRMRALGHGEAATLPTRHRHVQRPLAMARFETGPKSTCTAEEHGPLLWEGATRSSLDEQRWWWRRWRRTRWTIATCCQSR